MQITWEAILFKLLSVFLISSITASSIYFINEFIKGSRGKDILGLSENATYFKWVGGAVLTTLLLYGLQIISFKIQAIVIVAFVWDKFFEKMYNTAQSDVSKDKEDMEQVSPEELESIS